MLPGLRSVPLLAALWFSLTTAALAAPAATERLRLAAERQAAESRYAAEEAECQQRFIVTSCVDDVRLRRRVALAGLRQQEHALDDAERRARAAERQQAVERKSAEAASRPAASAPPPNLRLRAAASAASGASGASGASATVPSEPAGRKGPGPEAARDAARRASAAEQRRLIAEAGRARIAAREAERVARGKPAAPLPLPGELAGSNPAR